MDRLNMLQKVYAISRFKFCSLFVCLFVNAVLLAKEQSLPILNVLCLTTPAPAGLELTPSWMVSESTTTRLTASGFVGWTV
jgi:hypothetical protein